MIWERFRRIDPRYVDTALVVLLLPIYFGWAARQELLAASLPVAAAQTFPLLVRRRYPVHVLAVVVAATVTANLAFGSLLPFAAFLALYTVAANRERGVALRVGFLGLAALSLPLLRSSGWGFAEFAFRLVTFAAALAFGDGIRTRRAYVGELEARAERLEREREENVLRAAADEQARIARELHDVLAHNVSVMVVQAAAADDVFESHPDRARDALRSIESTGRAALTELRRLLGTVRAPEEEALVPQPGLARVGELVDRVRAAGLPVALRLEGGLDELPAGLDLSAYRIVQEALTNTLKHADASAAEVTVRRTGEGVELEVVDDGVGGEPAPEGQGLIGMRERAVLVGGAVEAGPLEGGGFRVRARLPLAQEQPV